MIVVNILIAESTRFILSESGTKRRTKLQTKEEGINTCNNVYNRIYCKYTYENINMIYTQKGT